ncbi:methyl-accepting chemotaxis protein [Celerinatantimonas yamalensis]|uniref:Methyl-accepting chemotaxis protein n=1 Tax=Celerinatantimonas yamalensis TaxID=559956 RepID=A0ABW9GAD8_9GAMM
MKQAMLSQWERLITHISLKHKIYLMIVSSLIVLVAKLFFDGYLVTQDVNNIQSHNMVTEARQLAQLADQHQGDNGFLQTMIQANVHYQVAIVDANGQALAGQPPATIPEAGKVVQAADFLTYVVPLNNGQQLVMQHSLNADSHVVSQFWQRSLIVTVIVAVGFIALLMAAARVLIKQVELLRQQLRLMANKDFTVPNMMGSRDEFGSIERAANDTRIDLVKVFTEQRKTTEQLLDLAEQMALCMDETKDATQEEFSQIEQLASAMSEVAATVHNVADNAEQAALATQEANKLAHQGNNDVTQSIKTISLLAQNIDRSTQAVKQVEERVVSIGSVVDTINSISEQTNLLALNAAIEAARAGEHGRGFAVVADEVRNLAQRTQNATVEIHKMIEQLQVSARDAGQLMKASVEYAEQSVEQVSAAGDGLEQIVTQVQKITDMNSQIATASEQQSAVALQMDQNLIQVKELIQGSVTVIDELAETAQMIEHQGRELGQLALAFRISQEPDETK